MTIENVTMGQGAPNLSSAIALANAATVVIGVYRAISGKNISDSLNGSRLMQEQLAQLACARITKDLQERHNKAKAIRLNGYNA